MDNQYFILSSYGFLSLEGESSATYLQGQLTQDVRALSEQQSQATLLCSLKGRIIAAMLLVKLQHIMLILPLSLVDKVIKSLEKSALFSRVKIQQNKDYTLMGLYLPLQADLPFKLPQDQNQCLKIDDATLIKIADNLYYLITQKQHEAYWDNKLKTIAKLGSFNTWKTLMLGAQYIEIEAQTSDLFLPHRLNLHLKNFISFNKGCYRGQEIIARMHYKSTPKHELIIVSQPIPAVLPKPGDKIYTLDETKELGDVIDLAILDEHTMLIALSILIERPNTYCFKSQDHSQT